MIISNIFNLYQYLQIIMEEYTLPHISQETREKLASYGFKNHLYDYLELPSIYVPRAKGCMMLSSQLILIPISLWDLALLEEFWPKATELMLLASFAHLLLRLSCPSFKRKRLIQSITQSIQSNSHSIQTSPFHSFAAIPYSKSIL